MSSPWLCYGTTNVLAYSTLLMPIPSLNGLIGEVAALPYQVPAGSWLQLQGWGVSSVGSGATVGMFPIIGGATSDVRKRLPAAVAYGGVGTVSGSFILNTGSVLAFGLVNNQDTQSLLSWYAYGNLVPITGK